MSDIFFVQLEQRGNLFANLFLFHQHVGNYYDYPAAAFMRTTAEISSHVFDLQFYTVSRKIGTLNFLL